MAENYTQFPNWLLAKLYTANDLTGRELRVILYIIRKTTGFHKKSDKLPYGQIAQGTGIDRRSVIRIIQTLEEKGWLKVSRKDKCINILRLQGGGADATSGGGMDGRNLVARTPPSKENQKRVLSDTPLGGGDPQVKKIERERLWAMANEEAEEEGYE